MNPRAISKEEHLEHTGLYPHIKIRVEIGLHRQYPDTFEPVHISPKRASGETE